MVWFLNRTLIDRRTAQGNRKGSAFPFFKGAVCPEIVGTAAGLERRWLSTPQSVVPGAFRSLCLRSKFIRAR